MLYLCSKEQHPMLVPSYSLKGVPHAFCINCLHSNMYFNLYFEAKYRTNWVPLNRQIEFWFNRECNSVLLNADSNSLRNSLKRQENKREIHVGFMMPENITAEHILMVCCTQYKWQRIQKNHLILLNLDLLRYWCTFQNMEFLMRRHFAHLPQACWCTYKQDYLR